MAVACGERSGAARQEPPARREPAATAGPIENGAPMPPAVRAGGVPPYPGAVVWMRVPRPPSEFHALESFTPDSFLQVVAFYDSTLSTWRRTVAKDAVHYHRDPNIATVIVSPWEGGDVPEDGPRPLREARTSIGMAWKEGL